MGENATASTRPARSWRERTTTRSASTIQRRSPVATSHAVTWWSDPATTVPPSGESASAVIQSPAARASGAMASWPTTRPAARSTTSIRAALPFGRTPTKARAPPGATPTAIASPSIETWRAAAPGSARSHTKMPFDAAAATATRPSGVTAKPFTYAPSDEDPLGHARVTADRRPSSKSATAFPSTPIHGWPACPGSRRSLSPVGLPRRSRNAPTTLSRAVSTRNDCVCPTASSFGRGPHSTAIGGRSMGRRSVRSRARSRTSQTVTARAFDAEARSRPSGVKASDSMSSFCRCSMILTRGASRHRSGRGGGAGPARGRRDLRHDRLGARRLRATAGARHGESSQGGAEPGAPGDHDGFARSALTRGSSRYA